MFQDASKFCRNTFNCVRNTYIRNAMDDSENAKKKLLSFFKSKRKDITGVSPLTNKNCDI